MCSFLQGERTAKNSTRLRARTVSGKLNSSEADGKLGRNVKIAQKGQLAKAERCFT